MVLVPQLSGGQKDSSDVMLAMDAAEVALSGAPAVGVVSADVDFSILLRKLRSWGVWTVAAYPKLRQSNMPEQLAIAADEVVHYCLSKPAAPPLQRIIMDTDKLEGKVEVAEDADTEALSEILISEDALDKLRTLLVTFGFLKSREDGPLIDALVKFFHVNKLGKLTIWPQKLAIREAANKISQERRPRWKTNPGNLALVQPLSAASSPGERTNFRRLTQLGGPFLCRIDSTLVERVLRRFGYLDDRWDLAGDNIEEAGTLFCRINQKQLQRLQHRSHWHELHVLLSAQRLQAWRLPYSDRPLQQHFQAQNLLPKATTSWVATRAAMRSAMQTQLGRSQMISSWERRR